MRLGTDEGRFGLQGKGATPSVRLAHFEGQGDGALDLGRIGRGELVVEIDDEGRHQRIVDGVARLQAGARIHRGGGTGVIPELSSVLEARFAGNGLGRRLGERGHGQQQGADGQDCQREDRAVGGAGRPALASRLGWGGRLVALLLNRVAAHGQHQDGPEQEREHRQAGGRAQRHQERPGAPHDEPRLADDLVPGWRVGVDPRVVVALQDVMSALPADDAMNDRSDLGVMIGDDLVDFVGRRPAGKHQVALVQRRLHAGAGDDDVGRLAAEGGGRQQHPGGGHGDEQRRASMSRSSAVWFASLIPHAGAQPAESAGCAPDRIDPAWPSSTPRRAARARRRPTRSGCRT